MYTYTTAPFLIALVIGLACQGLYIYEINAWNVGTAKTEPWRTKAAALLSQLAAPLSFLGVCWRHRRAIAAGALIATALLYPDLLGRADGVAFGMALNVAAMERDFDTKKTEAKTKLEAVMQLAEKEERELTDKERGEVQALLDEAKNLKSRIERAKGDSSLTEEIERLTASMTRPASSPAGHTPRSVLKSLGQQWIESDAFKYFKDGQHHGNANWRSPSVELQATTLDESGGSGGPLIVTDYRPGILPLLFKRLVVADLIPDGQTDSNSITYMKETTFTNAAAPVAEGGTKPESTLVFAQVSDTVRKIAHWLPVTEEMLEDVAQIRSYIDSRLRLGVQLTEEDQLLNGSGTPPAIQGILNRSGLTAAQARGADTNADAIFKQITTIATTVFVQPDGIVMNPTNWQTIQLAKDANGNYYGAGPFAPAQQQTLWGLPVVKTPTIVANTALVGAFQQSAQVFRKGGIRVEASNSHQDYFIKNLVAIRAEERLALAVYRPSAFGTVTGLN